MLKTNQSPVLEWKGRNQETDEYTATTNTNHNHISIDLSKEEISEIPVFSICVCYFISYNCKKMKVSTLDEYYLMKKQKSFYPNRFALLFHKFRYKSWNLCYYYFSLLKMVTTVNEKAKSTF